MCAMKSRNIKISTMSAAIILIAYSCSKNNDNTVVSPPVAGSSYLAVTNVSPTTNTYGVYSDNTNIYSSGTIGYGSSTGVMNGSPYETISDSTHSIYLDNNGVRTNIDSGFAFQNNSYYSLLTYDTGAQMKTLALKDNLTAPASGEAEVRVLNLSSYGQPLNVWFVNTDTTMKDSVQLANVSYAGAEGVIADSLGAFKPIAPGTYKVLFNSTANANLFTRDTLTVAAGGIYTIYSQGYLNGNNGTDSLNLGVIRNY